MDRDAPPPVTPRRLPRRRWLLPAAILGWIVPGLGQLWTGQPRKALLFALAILGTFGLGWWLTAFSVVDPEQYRLDFLAQAFLGGPTAWALRWGPEPALTAMPRFFDVGRLYVQVAGLLNLVAMADAVGEGIRQNRRVMALQAADEDARRAEADAALLPASARSTERPAVLLPGFVPPEENA